MDAERHKWLHSMGVCTRCKKRDAYTMAGRWLCAECGEVKNAQTRERRRASDRNAKERQRRAERKAAGLCTYCGKALEPGQGARCPRCAALWRGYARRYQERHPRSVNWPRGSNGVCFQCNKADAMPGRSLCFACYERSAASARRIPRGAGSKKWKAEVDGYWRSVSASKGSAKSLPRPGSLT